jgi:hypothetical protein
MTYEKEKENWVFGALFDFGASVEWGVASALVWHLDWGSICI